MRSKSKSPTKKHAKNKKFSNKKPKNCKLRTNVLSVEKQVRLKQKRKNYDPEVLQEAAQAVKKGSSLRKAAIAHGVPVTSLFRTVKEPERNCKSGPKTILTPEEENHISEWILHRAKIGCPVTKAQLLENIQSYILSENRETPFKNGKPGRHWYEAFRKRHPKLTIRTPQYLTTVRVSATEDHIRGWFGDIQEYLSQKNLLNIDSSRVFNCDETGIYFCPKGDKVFAEKGVPAVYQVTKGCDKEKLSVLFMFSANGMQAPPLIVYSYKKNIPRKVIESVPSGWGVGMAENGYMTKEVFYEYMTNVFYPWLVQKEITFPVILYFDGHSSHMTIPLVEFCREKQIELITLYPNATHLYQPLDIAFFHPLKVLWKKVVLQWKEEKCQKISNENFAQVLLMALNSMQNLEQTISNGFRASGLVPFDANAIDYNILYKKKKSDRKNSEQANETHNNERVVNSTMFEDSQFLKAFEQSLPGSVLEEFQNALNNGGIWTGEVEKTSLFEYWLQTKATVGKCLREGDNSVVKIFPDIETAVSNDSIEKVQESEILNLSNIVVLNVESDFPDNVMLASSNHGNCPLDNTVAKENIVNSAASVEVFNSSESLMKNEVSEKEVYVINRLLDDNASLMCNNSQALTTDSNTECSNILTNGSLNNDFSETSTFHSSTSNTLVDDSSNIDSFEALIADINSKNSNLSVNDSLNTSPMNDAMTNNMPENRENSSLLANQGNDSLDPVKNFIKRFPIEHLAEKKRKQAQTSKKPSLPSAGCSDAWLEQQTKKFKEKQMKEEEKQRRKTIMEEKKKLLLDKKNIEKQMSELQRKLKKEKP